MQSGLVETWRCRSLRKPGTSALVRETRSFCANKKSGYTNIIQIYFFPKITFGKKALSFQIKTTIRNYVGDVGESNDIFYSTIDVCCSF